MAITTMDAVVSALASGNRLDFYKASLTAKGAGTWHSLLLSAGIPIAGSIPALVTGVVCTDTTPGAFTGITWTNQVYLLQAVVSGATAGKLILYDRLWHNAGLVCNVTSLQAINQADAIPRGPSSGTGVEAWGQFYAAPGATGTDFTLTYTGSDGVTSKTAIYTHPANAEKVGQMVPFVCQAACSGVASVQSLRLTASTGTAGNFGIVLLRRVAELPIQLVNAGDCFDFTYLGMPKVYANACLQFMVMCSTTNTGIIQGSLTFGNG